MLGFLHNKKLPAVKAELLSQRAVKLLKCRTKLFINKGLFGLTLI